MTLKFEDIGQRLRAYRVGKNYTAKQIAEKIGVSRAAVYRLEKGELVKIETLERLSVLLDASLPSLLGVEVEYYNNSLAYFERMRQLEEKAGRVVGNFSPCSLLLFSDEYMGHLRTMLLECEPDERVDPRKHEQRIDLIMAINQERRAMAAKRRTPVVSIVGERGLERFLRIGLVGRYDLSGAVLRKRRQAAREEVERLVEIMAKPPMGVQFGIVNDISHSQTCQVLEGPSTAVTLSPFRFSALPNVQSGIAMVTSSPEAVRLFQDTLTAQWRDAHKHDAGVAMLKDLLKRTTVDREPLNREL